MKNADRDRQWSQRAMAIAGDDRIRLTGISHKIGTR